MPSHKELLQKRFDSAEHAFFEAANETTRLEGQLRAERKAIDELTDKYNTACRQLATGAAGVEPATILAVRDRRSHRLRGLEVLYEEAKDALKPLHDERQAAGQALQAELDRGEIERLTAAVAATNKELDDAKDAQNAADQRHRAAGHALWLFQKSLELKAKQAA